jgi:hypothetical protein
VPNPVQWSADQLMEQLASLRARAQAEFDVIGQNNQAVTELYAQADQITDPATMAAVKARLQAIGNRQAGLQNDFNNAWRAYQSAYNSAAAFLRSIGLNAPDSAALSGLGQFQVLVPVAIVAVVVTAGLWFAANHDNNVTQRQLLSSEQERVNAVLGGQMSVADYTAMSQADTKQADQLRKPNPGGDLTGMIVPALALLALIFVGPKLLDLFGRKRSAA